MPIKTDRSDLPAGHMADSEPRFGPKLMSAWLDDQGDGSLAHAVEGTKFRASWAAGCSRKLWYEFTDTPESNPITVADRYRFWLGHTVHDAVQKFTPAIADKVQSELEGDLRPALDGSYHADMLVEMDGKKILVEIKTINGFGYKMAATSFKGPHQGPRHNAVVQGALAAHNEDADELVILYLSQENVSPALAHYTGADDFNRELSRFCSEWTFPKEEFTEIAEVEIDRVNHIMERVEDDPTKPILRRIPDPELPVDNEIDDSSTGRWVVRDASVGGILDSGKTWHCSYCSFQDKCHSDGR